MTPGEKRKNITKVDRDVLLAGIATAIRDAIEAEREACALTAEREVTWVHYDPYEVQVDMRARIAAAIRARGVARSTQEISPIPNNGALSDE